MKCPRCNNELKYIFAKVKINKLERIYPDGSRRNKMEEVTGREYICPECGEVICFTEEQAKDLLKSQLEKKIDEVNKG